MKRARTAQNRKEEQMDNKTHRYLVCPIGYAYWQDPHRETDPGLHDAVLATDDLREAKNFAGREASRYEFGLAIVDLVTGVVDFGDWKRTYNLRDRWPA
jgi:hypothetical protein